MKIRVDFPRRNDAISFHSESVSFYTFDHLNSMHIVFVCFPTQSNVLEIIAFVEQKIFFSSIGQIETTFHPDH